LTPCLVTVSTIVASVRASTGPSANGVARTRAA